MMREPHVVDNRVFLLGLDDLYRRAMKWNEGFELLRCAREVAWALHVQPAAVPVEGYYAEDEHLTEYFRVLRALQAETNSRGRPLGHRSLSGASTQSSPIKPTDSFAPSMRSSRRACACLPRRLRTQQRIGVRVMKRRSWVAACGSDTTAGANP